MIDMPASSALTRKRLCWHRAGVKLISDLNQMRYFENWLPIESWTKVYIYAYQ
jgi:hypothetical protein